MRLEWGGQAIDVREAGAGPALVLVHGYPLDGAMWSGVARTLAARFRALKPDLPGRGENPVAASGDIEGYADFLEALVKTLPSPVGLAGFSANPVMRSCSSTATTPKRVASAKGTSIAASVAEAPRS